MVAHPPVFGAHAPQKPEDTAPRDTESEQFEYDHHVLLRMDVEVCFSHTNSPSASPLLPSATFHSKALEYHHHQLGEIAPVPAERRGIGVRPFTAAP